MISVLNTLAAVWWIVAIGMLLLSFLAALAHPFFSAHWKDAGQPPVSAIVPLKYWNDHFEADQTSLFAQTYPRMEILLTAAESDSHALDVVRQVQQRFPQIDSRILKSDITAAASPKLNNLWSAMGQARHDLVLVKDSNIRLAPDDLELLVKCHRPGVGLVGMIPILRAPGNFPAWIETAFVNSCYGRLLMLASRLGIDVNPGKITLFSRAELDKAGGVESLAWAIGEDEALTRAFAGIGLRSVLSAHTSTHIAGLRSLQEVWERQSRWMLIWRHQTPGVFAGSVIVAALPAILAGSLAAPLAGFTALQGALATFVFWFGIESLLCLIKGWPLSFWSLPAFIGREVLALTVWLRALAGRHVEWGGQRHRVAGRRERDS